MEWFNEHVGMGFIVIGGITGVGLLIRYLAEAKVNHYFNKQLDQHKHNLDVMAKNAEYDLSKKLYDFEAYASKKHAVYPELYSLLFEPWIELSLFRHKFDLHIAHSKKDLDRDTLKSRFNDELHPIVQKLPNVSKYFYKNELYLSKNASTAYNEAFKELADLATNIYLNFRKNSRNDNWQDPSFSLIDIDEEELQRTEKKINILKEIIYKELSYTHSEEI